MPPVNTSTESMASTTPSTSTTPTVQGIPSQLGIRDYGYLYWPQNFRQVTGALETVRHVRTGHYGLVIDVSNGSIDALGVMEVESSAEEALVEDSSVVSSLPAGSVTYSASLGDGVHTATQFAGTGGDTANPSQLVDMGRFMQRLEIPVVSYGSDPGLEGSIQLAAMTRHFVLSHRVSRPDAGPLTVRLELDGDAVGQFDQDQWLEGTRALSIRDAAGEGWSFVLPEQAGMTSTITRDPDGSVLFEAAFDEVSGDEPAVLSVIAIPSTAATDTQLQVWIDPVAAVEVQYAQLNRDGTEAEDLVDAEWDPERGLFLIELRDLSNVGAPGWQDWADLSIHNWYNRHRVRIHNLLAADLSVPLALEGGNNAAFYIVGGSPLWRNLDGEPVGAPVQISKNWHEVPFWYHLYSALDLPPGEHEFEFTFAHSKWGSAYAAAHAQLSLIGWGTNQQWDESSMAAFGESITYDPDLTLNRSMVDDVRPFLVDAGSQWGWTGNVGGADFLTYVDESGVEQRLGRMKTLYAHTGPNLTKVAYSGVTADGKIAGTMTTQLGRTDDLLRAYYHLEYTVLQEVTYQRLALFQVAADGYADNGFTRYAYGNAAGVIEDMEVPEHQTVGYASEAERGIEISGSAAWAFLYSSDRDWGDLPEHLANVGFVVRDYRAVIGGVPTTTPHFNITRTYNGGESQMAFELGVPYEESQLVLPAGSTIQATVEYLIAPSDKDVYYGDSDHLLALDSALYQSPEMAVALAGGNELDVTAEVGTVLRTHPIELKVAADYTAAQFTVTGGLGYTPVTLVGLARPDGWTLEWLQDGSWVGLGQDVEGNDYWQAYDDSANGSFQLVFNLYNRGTQTYRLVRPEP